MKKLYFKILVKIFLCSYETLKKVSKEGWKSDTMETKKKQKCVKNETKEGQKRDKNTDKVEIKWRQNGDKVETKIQLKIYP